MISSNFVPFYPIFFSKSFSCNDETTIFETILHFEFFIFVVCFDKMIQKFKFLSKRTNSEQNENDHRITDHVNDQDTSHPEKILVSRNAVICSSGKVFD